MRTIKVKAIVAAATLAVAAAGSSAVTLAVTSTSTPATATWQSPYYPTEDSAQVSYVNGYFYVTPATP